MYGIKIKHDTETGDIRIFNTATGGDAYRELDEEEYSFFLDNGWREGCLLVALRHYNERLDKAIEMRERSIVRGVSKKRMHNVLSSIDTLTESINQIKSKLYGEHI